MYYCICSPHNPIPSPLLLHTGKDVNRGDKRTRRVRDRDFVKFERSRRYRDRYRCQEKKSRRGRARDPVFRDPPTPRTSPRSLFSDRDPPPCPVFSARIYRPSFRKNKPNTLVFSHSKRANWACFAKTRSLNLDTGQCFLLSDSYPAFFLLIATTSNKNF